MPYERIWVPELQAWKIVGELTGEEALALSKTIPAGMTQWGWGARSGTFAYGTTTDSHLQTYEAPPAELSHILINRPETYIPEFNLNQFEDVSGYAENGGDIGQALGIGLAILIGLPLLFGHKRRVKYGKIKSSRKKKITALLRKVK